MYVLKHADSYLAHNGTCFYLQPSQRLAVRLDDLTAQLAAPGVGYLSVHDSYRLVKLSPRHSDLPLDPDLAANVVETPF